ncbi:MAG: archaemetzincin family Zn-dependent metalloprotease [Fervidicoccaceae archaeon]
MRAPSIEVVGTIEVPLSIIERAALILSDALGLRATTVNRIPAPPSSTFDERRRQYKAEAVLAWASSHRREERALFLLLADVDAYVEGLNFVFGLALPRLGAAAVFLSRLKLPLEREGGLELLIERVEKESLHEVGHLLGLGHCSRRLCVMSFSNSLAEVDAKTSRFCSSCSALLASRGIIVRTSRAL